MCVLRERERERERELYPFPDLPTPKYICQYSKLPVSVFSDLWLDYLVCFVFCLFGGFFVCLFCFCGCTTDQSRQKKSVKWQFSANVWYIALKSDTGFERDSNRIFDPQLYFRYSKHLLKLYKRIQRLTDEIHQCVCTRLATVPSAIQLVSLLEAAMAIVADSTVVSLVQTHSDEFRP